MTILDSTFKPILHSYSPKNVILTVGTFIMTQWDEVIVEYDEDDWNFKVGCYNKIVRTKTNNSLGTITIKLPQTSSGNAYNSVSAILTNDVKGIDGIIPVLVTDLWGGSLHAMAKGSILKRPRATYAAKVSPRTWKIRGELDVSLLSAANAINSLSSII